MLFSSHFPLFLLILMSSVSLAGYTLSLRNKVKSCESLKDWINRHKCISHANVDFHIYAVVIKWATILKMRRNFEIRDDIHETLMLSVFFVFFYIFRKHKVQPFKAHCCSIWQLKLTKWHFMLFCGIIHMWEMQWWWIFIRMLSPNFSYNDIKVLPV